MGPGGLRAALWWCLGRGAGACGVWGRIYIYHMRAIRMRGGQRWVQISRSRSSKQAGKQASWQRTRRACSADMAKDVAKNVAKNVAARAVVAKGHDSQDLTAKRHDSEDDVERKADASGPHAKWGGGGSGGSAIDCSRSKSCHLGASCDSNAPDRWTARQMDR
ncbi:hypothetical protein PMIN06_008200 [Paraphaeosphaeria minitans]